VSPVLPLHRVLLDQPEVGLVDERGRLERVVRPLNREIVASEAAQLRVHRRGHLVESGLASHKSTGHALRLLH
jgi:hypothetical protein